MSPSPNSSADVVIIGGGIVGLATACYLARRKVGVVLLEKGRLAWEQSSRNWGFVRQQGRDPAELPMMVQANRLWRAIGEEADADTEWRQGGNLALAQSEEALALYEEGREQARQHGIDTRVLSKAEVRALLPDYQGPYLGGLHTPSDGQADPYKGTLAFAKAARQAGADLREYVAVEGFELAGGHIAGVRTTQGSIATNTVVCAAGAHSAFLARMVGLSLPQRAVRSSVARTAPLPHITDLGVWGGTVGFRQTRDGRVVLGRTSAGVADYDVTLDGLRHLRLFLPIFLKNRDMFRMRVGKPLWQDIWRRIPGTAGHRHPFAHAVDEEPPVNEKTLASSAALFQTYFPHLGPVTIEHRWAGLIDATPDLLPVLGEARARPGFIFATGFSGHGFGLGPGAGHALAQLIAEGRSDLDLRPMRFERFAEGDMSKAKKIL
jgi:glycine/D-amino acid oxidase-like deaminating enzyme